MYYWVHLVYVLVHLNEKNTLDSCWLKLSTWFIWMDYISTKYVTQSVSTLFSKRWAWLKCCILYIMIRHIKHRKTRREKEWQRLNTGDISYHWGRMRAGWTVRCYSPSGESCAGGACWESASQTSCHNRDSCFVFVFFTQRLIKKRWWWQLQVYLKSSRMGNGLLSGGVNATLSWMACCKCSWVMLKLW